MLSLLRQLCDSAAFAYYMPIFAAASHAMFASLPLLTHAAAIDDAAATLPRCR